MVVVLGGGIREIQKKVKFRDEVLVFNAEYRRGMSGSLRMGLKAVGPDAEAALVVLGDQPYVSDATIDALVDAYRASRAKVVAPVFQGHRGNPILFDRSLFRQIMKLRGDRGAKSVVEGNADSLLEVEVDDRGILLDIDTPEDTLGAERVRARQMRSRG